VRPSERLTLLALLAATALTVVLWPAGAVPRLAVFLAMAAATVWLLPAKTGTAPGFVRDWLPVAIVITMFLLLQPIIEAGVSWRLDDWLAAIDARYLGWLVGPWFGAFGRPAPLTDAVYAAYFSFYLLPITVAAIAWRRDAVTFERTVFPLLLTFYLTFLGYLLLPAAGPRLAAAEEARQLGGGALSDLVRAFLHAAEATTLDAFPSGHTAVAVVAGALGWRLLRPAAAAAVWAWAVAVVFATVYLHVHYAADILAGLLVAAAVLTACRKRRRGRATIRA
jgi:membrane-associated phospholipid phosphatase